MKITKIFICFLSALFIFGIASVTFAKEKAESLITPSEMRQLAEQQKKDILEGAEYLVACIEDNDTEDFRWYYEEVLEKKISDDEWSQLLTAAIDYEEEEIVNILLEQRKEQDSGYCSIYAFYNAAESIKVGNEKIFKLILANRPTLARMSTWYDNVSNQTLLILAAERGTYGMVEELIKKQAVVFQTNDKGIGALDVAKDEDIITLLKKNYKTEVKF